LRGQALGATNIAAAALASTREAQPLRDNAFKVPLVQRALTRALQLAGGAA
jgi:CO/xanthine dehydrogenase FAD-binding subunit